MDDYMFKANVDRCRNVVEATTYLELFSYSVWGQLKRRVWELICLQDPKYNSVEEHPLTFDEFDNYLHRRVRCADE